MNIGLYGRFLFSTVNILNECSVERMPAIGDQTIFLSGSEIVDYKMYTTAFFIYFFGCFVLSKIVTIEFKIT